MYFLNLIHSVDVHRHKVKPLKKWDKMQKCFRKLFQMFQWGRLAFLASFSSALVLILSSSPVSFISLLLWHGEFRWPGLGVSYSDWLPTRVVTAPLKLLSLNVLLKTSLKEISPYGPEYALRLPYDSTVHTNKQGKKSKPLIIHHAHE